MDGKSQNLGQASGRPPKWPQRPAGRARKILIAIAILSSLLYAFAAPSRLLSSLPWTCTRKETSPLLAYDGEHISWKPCGDVKGHPLECSSVDVPMDQFDLRNSGSRTFSIPLLRMRGQNATQNLLLNPGGPGGSGLQFIHRWGPQLRSIVGEGFHLLSFDPRGINSSRPVASCYPDGETRRNLSPVRSGNVFADSAELYAWSRNFVRACADTVPEHGKYINTPQTAADMNSILDALGQQDMVYWGFSYGTLLGQTYAGLFPGRSKRVIIDGVVNQFEWYGSLYDTESLLDAENVLDGFFDECVRAGPVNCPLSSLADTKEELHKTVLSFTEELRDQPLSVYVNNSAYGLLDFKKIWFNGAFPALYKPLIWPSLAERLYRLLQGNATDAFLAYGSDEIQASADEANDFVTLNDGFSGPGHWPQDEESMLDQVAPFLNSSLFGPTQHKQYYSRQQWAVPKTHTYVPRKGVETAHPLLILSTTYDPVCPLVSARSAQESFAGSQIVEVKGYGHCSISLTSVCIAKHVREFLYDGRVPDKYTLCEADSPYFPAPEEVGRLVAQKTFEDPAEQRIHLAQLELARDWDVPMRY